MKLSIKYFLIFSSLFIVLSLSIGLASYLISRSIIVEKYSESSRENLNYLLDITDKEMDQMENLFDIIGSYSALINRIETNYGENDAYKKMKDDDEVIQLFLHLDADDLFHSVNLIYITGTNGEEFWYGIGSEYLDRNVVAETISNSNKTKGQLYYAGIGGSYDKMNNSLQVLRFTRPISNTGGAVIGNMYIELEASHFTNIFHEEYRLSGTQIALVDNDDRIIYDQDSLKISSEYVVEDTSNFKIDDTTESYNWKLHWETPREYILEDSKDILTTTVIMILVSIGITLLLIIFISRRLVKPIRDLINAMGEVIKGDYSVRVDHRGDDEIGQLTDQFNTMTERVKDNLEKEVAYTKAINDADYKALQAQINPHFMYNSLNTVKWIATLQGADSITKVVDSLWKLLKKTSSLEGQIITLESEIEVIEAYVTIQQARYNGKFKITYDINPENLHVRLPKYILQPIVENAIFHGIEPKEGQGVVGVKTHVSNEDLIIEIEDDGVGVELGKIKEILNSKDEQSHESGLNNIGVRNVHERLKLLYGESYGIQFESELGFGTTVRLRIPMYSGKG